LGNDPQRDIVMARPVSISPADGRETGRNVARD
jgi:hypothetical protein